MAAVAIEIGNKEANDIALMSWTVVLAQLLIFHFSFFTLHLILTDVFADIFLNNRKNEQDIKQELRIGGEG